MAAFMDNSETKTKNDDRNTWKAKQNRKHNENERSLIRIHDNRSEVQ
jgi:hypothetical protein